LTHLCKLPEKGWTPEWDPFSKPGEKLVYQKVGPLMVANGGLNGGVKKKKCLKGLTSKIPWNTVTPVPNKRGKKTTIKA